VYPSAEERSESVFTSLKFGELNGEEERVFYIQRMAPQRLFGQKVIVMPLKKWVYNHNMNSCENEVKAARNPLRKM
jgi:hypothetical protein